MDISFIHVDVILFGVIKGHQGQYVSRLTLNYFQ